MLNMNIDSDLVKRLRSQQHWSQEQLGDACGLSLRTVQRLESSGKASTETVRALAAVFEISPEDLITDGLEFALTPVDAVKTCLTNMPTLRVPHRELSTGGFSCL